MQQNTQDSLQAALPKYVYLKRYIQENSSATDVALDDMLSKLSLQNVIDLEDILKEFCEDGGGDLEMYDNGYSNGYDKGFSAGCQRSN